MSAPSSLSPGYGPRVDAVVYGSSATASYTRADWIALAIAALDQAGASVEVQGEVRELVRQEDDFEAFSEGEDDSRCNCGAESGHFACARSGQ